MKVPGVRLSIGLATMLVITACGGQAEQAGTEESLGESPATTSQSPASTSPSTSAAPPTTAATTSTVPETTTTTVAEEVEATPLSSVVGDTIRGDGWLVEPGWYSTELGDRTFTFKVTEPVVYFESDSLLRFGPDTSSDVMDMFAISEYVGVIPPGRVSEHAPHDPVIPTYAEPMPESLGSWLTAVSQVSASDQIALASSAGLTGRAWDAEIDGDQGGTFQCPFGDCIGSLVQPDQGVWVLFEDARFRLWQLDGSGEGLYGFLQSRPETFDETVALAEMILADMKIEASG